MGTSSALSTSNQYIKYKITITQNSQSVTNNTSNVTVSVKFYRTNTGYETYGTGTVYCKINGTTYSAAVTSSQKITNSGIVLFSKTLNIAHSADGTKKLTCSAWIDHQRVTSSEQSYSQTLTTIPRKSSLAASNGTLNTAQTLTVTRQSSSFTHTITYTCGTASGTVCTKSSSTSISFTPPLSLASQNTTGTSVSIKFTITTYNGSTSLGANTKTISCTIPASVKPSCSISVSDATGYYDKYGAYVKGYSKLKVTVTPTLAYNSPIASYSVKANGSTYTKASFTTGVIQETLDNLSLSTALVTATVKDKRGRTSEQASAAISVYNYSLPQITALKVKRCDANGTENAKGEYAMVTFSAKITTLGGKNTAAYKLKYKKADDTEYTEYTFSSTSYNVTDLYYIFAADTGSSYNVVICATDDFDTITSHADVSTASVPMHLRADGKGLGIGKIGEVENGLDVGYTIRANAGFLQPELAAGTNFNNVFTPNTYTLINTSSAAYVNCPLLSGTGTLKVEACGEEGQIHQIVTVCTKTNPLVYERFYYQSAWGEWVNTTNFAGVLLWTGAYYMQASHTIQLAEAVSKQRTGIVLVFSYFSDNAAQDFNFNQFFISKKFVASQVGKGSTFIMSTATPFDVMCSKYLYINDTQILGHDNNIKTGTGASGITFNNKGFVLRYVIGV